MQLSFINIIIKDISSASFLQIKIYLRMLFFNAGKEYKR